jgi:hypothetical protein
MPLKCVFPLYPLEVFHSYPRVYILFYDFKEYMVSIASFKNILQYSRMEFNFDNEFYSN